MPVAIQEVEPLAYFREIHIEEYLFRLAPATEGYRIVRSLKPYCYGGLPARFIHLAYGRLHKRDKQQWRNQYMRASLVGLDVECEHPGIHLFQRKIVTQELYLRAKQYPFPVAIVQLVSQ